MTTWENPKAQHDMYPSLADALMAKNKALAERLGGVNVWLSVDEIEETITTLYEVVGHMAEDVGSEGYEFRLIQRARHHARMLQASLLASILPYADEIAAARKEHIQLIDEASQTHEQEDAGAEPD